MTDQQLQDLFDQVRAELNRLRDVERENGRLKARIAALQDESAITNGLLAQVHEALGTTSDELNASGRTEAEMVLELHREADKLREGIEELIEAFEDRSVPIEQLQRVLDDVYVKPPGSNLAAKANTQQTVLRVGQVWRDEDGDEAAVVTLEGGKVGYLWTRVAGEILPIYGEVRPWHRTFADWRKNFSFVREPEAAPIDDAEPAAGDYVARAVVP